MKVFVVLAIAVFTSCHVNAQFIDPEGIELDDFIEDFREPFEEEISEGDTERPYIVDKFIVAHDHLIALNDRLLDSLRLNAMVAKLQSYADELSEDLRKQVEELKKDITSYTDMLDPENLNAKMLQKNKELKKSVKKVVKDLQSKLNTYTDDLKQKAERSLEEVQTSMVSLTQNFQTQLTQVAQDLQKNAVSFGEGIGQSLANQLTLFWEAITKS